MREDIRNRQVEMAECGLACIADCGGALGSRLELSWLRQKFPISSRGTSFRQLIEIAGQAGLSARPVRCTAEAIAELKTPAILHWSMNHFVVLRRCGKRRITIFDPRRGVVDITASTLQDNFTGVALEVSLVEAFKKRRDQSPLSISGVLHLDRDAKGALIQIALVSAVLQVYLIAAPFYIQIAVDRVNENGDQEFLVALAVGFALFSIFNAVADVARSVALQRLNAMLSWDMTQRLFHRAIRLPLSWFQKRRLADTVSRFQSLDPIKALISGGLVASLFDGAMSIVALVMMFILSPLLALICLSLLVLYLVVRISSIPILMRYSADALQASIAEQGKRLECFRAIQTIKVMAGENFKEYDWSNKLADSIISARKSALASNYISVGQRLVDSLSICVAIYIGVSLSLSGKFTIGMLYAFLSFRTQFVTRIISVTDQLVTWRLLDVYMYRLADIALAPVEDGIDSDSQRDAAIKGELCLNNISFRYGPTDPPVVEGLSLRIAAGEFVGIRGPSGTGKSTLVKLLCGLYACETGQVLLDGQPLSVWGLKTVRRAFGVVLQDDELLPGTVMENVTFWAEDPDHALVWECLEKAGIDDEVRSWPLGLESFLGDVGAGISGGQKQRLLLARALYKRPKVLILDEASSHLDPERERLINIELAALGITRVVIAHRIETLRAASRILTLRHGVLDEISHDELEAV